MNRARSIALTLSAGVFAFYLVSMPPTLPAYRDAGEMATSVNTLGVSHPPSYPFYILLGNAFSHIPLGNPAWRLTLFSVVAAALACGVMFLVSSMASGFFAGCIAVLALSMNTTFWSVAVVPEMYSLTLLLALTLLAIALKLRGRFDIPHWLFFCFLSGLFLGNRTDLLLWAPGLLWIATDELNAVRNAGIRKIFLLPLLFFIVGFSVYLYLPVRSSGNPWLDWNHPAELQRFINSLTRRSYGGTLDLLSKSYATGENFEANLLVYAGHLWKDFLGLWLIGVPLGIYSTFQKDRCAAIGLMLTYLFSGPVFLFLANMPPNPHALAIVDPHYLLSDLIVAVWAGEGAAWIGRRTAALTSAQAENSPAEGRASGFRNADAPAAAVFLLLASVPAMAGWGLCARGEFWNRVNRRWNLFDYDFSLNLARSLPRDAVVVAKKDVQLFSLWYYQTVEGHRPDIHVVAQGLSASPWYQTSRRRQGETAYVGPLRDSGEWREFASLNGAKSFASMDADFPGDLTLGSIVGIAGNLTSTAAPDDSRWNLIARRGDFEYDEQPEFFDSDIVDAYAQARLRLGSFYIQHGRLDQGIGHVLSALSMHWLVPEGAVYLGFAFAERKRFEDASAAYGWALALFDRSLALAGQYHALPGVVDGIRRGKAEAQVNYGVVLEKLNKPDEAREQYRQAVALAPNYAQAHYNLAVSYWGRDWSQVANEMQEVLRIDPRNADAAKYLMAARSKLGVRP